MIIHENRLHADDSHEISYLIFFPKLGTMSPNLSSAAVMIGALKVNGKLFYDYDLFRFVNTWGPL